MQVVSACSNTAHAEVVLICNEIERVLSVAKSTAVASPATATDPAAAPTPGTATRREMVCKALLPWLHAEIRISEFGSVVMPFTNPITEASAYSRKFLFAVAFPDNRRWDLSDPFGPMLPPVNRNPVGPVISDVVCVNHPVRLVGKAVGDAGRFGVPDV